MNRVMQPGETLDCSCIKSPPTAAALCKWSEESSDFSLRRCRAQTSRFVRSSRSVPEARNTQDSSGNLHDFDADGVEVMQR
jgi:hypothetical protein